MKTRITDEQRAALERLLGIAARDTGQSRRVADFLLAWWNASECGGFDLTDLWGVDPQIAGDMITIFTMLIHCCHYPDTLGYAEEFKALVREWRSNLTASDGKNRP